MVIELEPVQNKGIEEFVRRMNGSAPEVQNDLFYYYRTENLDLRVALKTGELIFAAASIKGFELPKEAKGDWLNLIPERLIGELRDQGIPNAKSVLKEARRMAHLSQLNGDEEGVFNKLRELLGSLGRPKNSLNLPPIPAKDIAFSASR